jgi:AraC-like DNA-binding protein
MSKKRHSVERGGGRGRDPEAGVLVRTYAVTHPSGSSISERAYDWAQLAYASAGVLTVHTTQGSWVVPPHRAVWIPAGVRHRLDMSGRVAVRTLYLSRALARGLPARCEAVNVSPLLRELVLEVVRLGLLRREVPAHARLARVVVDQLGTMPAVPLQLPMPLDPRARQVAERLLADPGGETLAGAAARAGASGRTIERAFRRETGLTLGRWRQRARFIEAMRRLAGGAPVTRVALEVGYESPSAFVSAFRRQLGTTPGRYFGRPPGASGPPGGGPGGSGTRP